MVLEDGTRITASTPAFDGFDLVHNVDARGQHFQMCSLHVPLSFRPLHTRPLQLTVNTEDRLDITRSTGAVPVRVMGHLSKHVGQVEVLPTCLVVDGSLLPFNTPSCVSLVHHKTKKPKKKKPKRKSKIFRFSLMFIRLLSIGFSFPTLHFLSFSFHAFFFLFFLLYLLLSFS